jgi:FkbM family methyltransferase
MKTISIITLSQYYRIENLFLLKDMLLDQTYFDKIKEWVIIDGSNKKNDDIEQQINKLRNTISIPIVFIEYENGAKIGKLRNKTNSMASGDILICCDDDDYYPPDRVKEAYEKLINSDCLIAGCSPTFMYDYILDKQYKFLSFGDNHSPNNAFAYKKEYVLNHSHDETVSNDEEISFTNNWTEPMVQLDALKTVNVSSHLHNTFNKRQLLVAYYNGQYKQMFEYDACMIPEKYYQRIKNTFIKTNETKYDIVYFCGESISWDPNDESLGGSEQAVKYLTQEWAKVGKSVVVYGSVTECTYKGVDYINWRKFPYHEKFNTLIVWRLMGIYCLYFHNLKVDKLYWDLHDNMKMTTETMRLLNLFRKKNRDFDKIMFKSEFHKTEFEYIHPKLNNDKYLIIPNGLRVNEINQFIEKYKDEKRNPYRFCYCSSYSRGLDNILKCVWPIIVQNEPKAELHLYYGMILETSEYKQYIQSLIIQSKNVMDHSREPLELIVREKMLSTYQLYLNNHPAEIDCINIREGLLCECIPIISNSGIYKERDGFKINVNYSTHDAKVLTFELNNAGRLIANILKYINGNDHYNFVSKLKESELLINWETVSNYWLNDQNYLINKVVNCNDQQLLEYRMKSKYDIIYFGYECTKWDSNEWTKLGGSEQALKYLSEYWAKNGYRVAVYTNIKECSYNGVDYYHWNKFDLTQIYNIIVCWRLISLEPFANIISDIKCNKIILDIHDNTPIIKAYAHVYEKCKNNIDTIIFKSLFSKNEFEKYCEIIHNFQIIPNGIRTEIFDSFRNCNIVRNKNKFIYASCYTRGLEKILLHIFPEILKVNSDAQLYICYGMNLVFDNQYKKNMQNLIKNTPNVIDLDCAELDELIKLKYECMFHLYPSASDTETDCITIRESLFCGCIPLLSNEGVFSERSGIHYDINFDDVNSLRKVGNQIGNFSKNITKEQYCDLTTKLLEEDKYMNNWENVGTKWITCFNNKYNTFLANLGKYQKIPDNHTNYLIKLRESGFRPKVIYDIGCCVLHWTREAKKIFPEAEIILFDAFGDAEFMYSDYKYHIGVLSNEDNKIVKWYENKVEPAGNSYYKEIGNEHSERLFPIDNYVNKITYTLDTIIKQYNFPYPDLIKIDTQGSEIDIINGSMNALKNTKYLIVELQHMKYNDGACLSHQSINLIENLGFKCIAEKFNETPVDGDYCFENKNIYLM